MYRGTLDPVSCRGDWQHTLALDTDGSTDPSTYVFRIDVRRLSGALPRLDYGQTFDGCCPAPILTVSTNDGSGNAIAEATDDGLLLTWLFPASRTAMHAPGPYEVSVMATLGTATDELGRLTFTVI